MTKISDLLKAGRTYSFEFFPPKTDSEQVRLVKTLRELEPLSPSFVSVTYRGGRSSRKRTHDLVVGMLKTTSLVPMAHLICVSHTRIELAEILVDLRKEGVENLMALGGDEPSDPNEPAGELKHAIELVELARAIGGFSIGVAAHPEGHPRSESLEKDRLYLKKKLELADFGVTQFFFETEKYEALVYDLDRLGINKPVIPGIMPVTSISSIPKMAAMGAKVPAAMADALVQAFKNSKSEEQAKMEVEKRGIEYATKLCKELLEKGAPGLHFYTLNRSSATRRIYENLGLVKA